MNRIRVAFVAAFLALFAIAASAQTPAPDNMTRLENVATTVEQSTFNRALPLFGDLYWQFTPQRFTARPDSTYVLQNGRLTPPEGPVAAYATAGLRANLQRLMGYARAKCGQLTPVQKAFLLGFAQSRFSALVDQYHARRTSLSTALGAPLKPIDTVTLVSAPDCARTASAGGDAVTVSSDLLLAALFSAMYVDQQYVIVPDRVFASMQAAMEGPKGDWNDRRGRRVLTRLQATPVWTNTMRGMRVMYQQEQLSLEDFQRDSIYGVYERQNPQCRRMGAECRTLNTVALSLTSALKVDMLFREQVDFILAHEIGHHALDHVSQPIGDCAVEKAREQAADLFAVGLMRPPEGLFAQPRLAASLEAARNIAFDGRFKSGLDLFMVQSHRVAVLTDGNNCAYPTFEERLATVQAFEARAFPR